MVKKTTSKGGNALKSRALSSKKNKKIKLASGILHVEASYNNTRASISTEDGNIVFTSSAGALGFKSAKKGTPFAAAKVGELVAEQSVAAGVKKVSVLIKGAGSGRDAVIRSFLSKGIDIESISDRTPIPFNGPRRRKVRRV